MNLTCRLQHATQSPIPIASSNVRKALELKTDVFYLGVSVWYSLHEKDGVRHCVSLNKEVEPLAGGPVHA